jgi:hypothetical protein
MSVRSVDYAPSLNLATTGDGYRGPSPVIWSDCPVLRQIENPDLGMYFFDDFLVTGHADMGSIFKGSIGQWSIYGAAGSLLDDDGKEGGCLTLTSGTDLDQTVLQSTVGSFRLVTTSTLALNQKLWFEARVAKSSISTDILEAFVGLADHNLSSSLPFVNSIFSGTDDTLATAPSFLGFYNKGDTAQTEWQVAFNLAGGTVNFPTGLTTLMNTSRGSVIAANEYVKLGFIFDPHPRFGPKQISTATARQTLGTVRQPLIRFFVNGIELPTFLDADDVQNATATQAFPTGFLAPVFGCAQHSTKGTFKIDWIRVCQLGNS